MARDLAGSEAWRRSLGSDSADAYATNEGLVWEQEGGCPNGVVHGGGQAAATHSADANQRRLRVGAST